jgi:tryptophanyl-tRNA synthetase
MLTPVPWLERNPTYKEQREQLQDRDLSTFGFLGYPVLQCGDIVMYGEPGAPLWVPVGEDQVSHVEISREIVRRFNSAFGTVKWETLTSDQERALRKHFHPAPPMTTWKDIGGSSPDKLQLAIQNSPLDYRQSIFANEQIQTKHVLAEPGAMLTKTPRVPGLDGRKMSKSYGNTITLSESDADIRAKTKVMVTDPARKRRTDPGNPDVCPVYDWHKLFSTKETLDWAAHGCRTAGIGCIDCKAKMADHLIEWITPVRERRVEYEKHSNRVLEVIDDGSNKARKVAQGTIERVREAVFGWEKKRKEVASGEKKVASGE